MQKLWVGVRSLLALMGLVMLVIAGLPAAFHAVADSGVRGVPEVLARLEALQADVRGLRGRVDDLHARMDQDPDEPFDVTTEFCFEADAGLGVGGGLSVAGTIGTEGFAGLDIYGVGAQLSGGGGTESSMEAGLTGEVQGQYVVCITGPSSKFGRELSPAQAAMVADMEAGGARLRDRTADFAANLNMNTAKIIAAADALESMDLNLNNPAAILAGGAGDIALLANTLPLNATIRQRLSQPADVIAAAAQVDPCELANIPGLPAHVTSQFIAICDDVTSQALEATIVATETVVNTVSTGVNSVITKVDGVRGVVNTTKGWVSTIYDWIHGIYDWVFPHD